MVNGARQAECAVPRAQGHVLLSRLSGLAVIIQHSASLRIRDRASWILKLLYLSIWVPLWLVWPVLGLQSGIKESQIKWNDERLQAESIWLTQYWVTSGYPLYYRCYECTNILKTWWKWNNTKFILFFFIVNTHKKVAHNTYSAVSVIRIWCINHNYNALADNY